MKFHLNRFLRRVRIHGGEFDTSARAMYREGVTSSLRADLRIVRGSTIERKQMSTKTTIKRLALVTVAALGLGVLTVAPSSAAPQLDTLALSSATASTTVGTAVTVNATVAFLQETSSDSMTLTLSYEAAPAGIAIGEVSFSDTATVATDLGSPTVDTTTARTAKVSAATAASINKTLKISLTPSKAGEYKIRVTPTITGSATAPSSTYKTWTVTVAAKTVGKSSAFIGAAVTSPVTDTHTADATIKVAGAGSVTPIARIDVGSIYGTTGNDTASAADAPSVVVATDKGLISATNAYVSGLKSVTTAAGTDADPSYWVFSNGDIGKASITITVGGVLLATKTVTFIGASKALVAGTPSATYTGIGAGKTSTNTFTSTDAGLTAVANPAGLTVTSSDTSVATVSAVVVTDTATGTVTVTGVKAGTTTITVTDPATSGKATSASYVVTVKANKPTTAPTITFDKPAYNVGDVVEMTVNADMADSATAQLFTAALVTSAAVTTVPGATALPATGVHAIVGGKATYKFYAPAVSGSFTVTGTGGSDVDLTTLVTAPVVTGTVAIDNPAVAAAELAEAAAQDATDAALEASEDAKLAVELAQQAVDAVADLSAQVTTLIAALKKQITTLTNLVKKIAAKK